MMVQAYLRERAADLESKTCSIEKVIELSASDFEHFRQAPLKDYNFISENKADLHCEQGIWQCLLILGADCEDGILVDPEGFDFALYTAFLPSARRLLPQDMEIDRSYQKVAEPWRDESRDEMLRMTLRVDGKPDYGKRYCLHSPTLDEEPLQQAVLAAINAAMSDHEALVAQITDAMEQELAPIPGEGMSLGDIDRATEELGKQFDNLLQEASNAVNTEEYAERFRAISSMIEELKRRKSNILQIRQEQERIECRVHAATAVMNTLPSELTEWDDNIVYQMLEKVSVLSREKIRVTFRGGTEIEQTVDQPKRRKFA